MVSTQVDLKSHLRTAIVDSTKLIQLEQEITRQVGQEQNHDLVVQLAHVLVSASPED